MTKERIERLRALAIAVAKEHNEGGVCGISPDLNFKTYKEEPRVHLSCTAFCEIFGKYETVEFDEFQDKLFVMVDGVQFFTLKEK